MEFEDFCNNDMKNERDIDRLIGKYLNLQQDLSSLEDMMDANTFAKYSKQIHEALRYLRHLSHTFNNVNDIINSM